MRYFFSVGEPSGDLHGSNLIHAIRERDPGAEVTGFGGGLMAAAGANLLFPLANHPVMGMSRVITSLPMFLHWLRRAEEYLARERPDVVVLVDNPGFNWRVAMRAKKLGLPVVYYVPPQIWSWATWRVAKMRRYVDHVLCTLPFEEAWYKQRGVTGARYVGHPFFDDLADRTTDLEFEANERALPGRRVALLPGSRETEVIWNAGPLIRAADRIAERIPSARFLVAGFKEAHRPILDKYLKSARAPIDVHFGRTPEIIRLAEVALSVSGSVSLELMYHQVPTVIAYHLDPVFRYVLYPLLVRTPYITLVNLMAGRTLYPEFITCFDQSGPMAQAAINWLENTSEAEQLRGRLRFLREQYAKPGATVHAADTIVDLARGRRPSIRAA